MSTFYYADGQDICVYEDGKITKLNSTYIEKYKENAANYARSQEWKRNGAGAAFRGDAYGDPFSPYSNDPMDMHFDCEISGVFPCSSSEVVYTFKVNRTSGIYKKNLTDEKAPETHVVNSCENVFYGGCLNAESGKLATCIKHNYYNSDIAVFDLASGDYKTVTEGDTLDEDPCFDPDNEEVIYYSSRGVGRDAHGEFAGFSPSAIYKLDTGRVDVQEVASSPNYSYFKPIYSGGKLYAIKAPAKEKHGNPLLEIILIPWRLLQAIVGFLNLFINAFSGKSVTEGGNNPAKGRDYDSKKIVIAGNLVDIEKQTKKNASKKDKDYGFVPASWQLVEVESGNVIKSGVADYDIAKDGTIIATNGRRIFEIKDGKCKKVANTEACIRVNCKHTAKKSSSLFVF